MSSSSKSTMHTTELDNDEIITKGETGSSLSAVARDDDDDDENQVLHDLLTKRAELEAASAAAELRGNKKADDGCNCWGAAKEESIRSAMLSDQKEQEKKKMAAGATMSCTGTPTAAAKEKGKGFSDRWHDATNQETAPPTSSSSEDPRSIEYQRQSTTGSTVGAYAVAGMGNLEQDQDTDDSNETASSSSNSIPEGALAPATTCTVDEETGLVLAQPVPDELAATISGTAEPVFAQQNQQDPKGQSAPRSLLSFICCVIVAVVIIASVSVAASESSTRRKGQVEPLASSSSKTSPPLLEAQTMMTAAPSNATAANSSSMLHQDTFRLQLPNFTLTQLDDPFSPQSLAFGWVTNHKNFDSLPDWRRQQLFALATFYHAFRGPQAWPAVIRDSWLDENKHECDWFSNNYGTFDSSGTTFQQGITEFTSLEACNTTTGEFVDLALGNLMLIMEDGDDDSIPPIVIPPEISLLTSLKFLHLYENQIQGNLQEFIPSELFQMTSLHEIGLRKNRLTGQIPSELGLLTQLSLLELADNQLTGRIPSELGLTTLSTLKVCCNLLTGSLPAEMVASSRLVNMDEFNVQHNQLTGTIPSAVWTLWPKLVVLQLGHNHFSGLGISSPQSTPANVDLGHLTNLYELDLSGLDRLNDDGSLLPTNELAHLVSNFNLSIVQLDTSPGLSGTIPEELCSLQESNCTFDFWWWPTTRNCSLTFDCSSSSNLCGCDCPC